MTGITPMMSANRTRYQGTTCKGGRAECKRATPKKKHTRALKTQRRRGLPRTQPNNARSADSGEGDTFTPTSTHAVTSWLASGETQTVHPSKRRLLASLALLGEKERGECWLLPDELASRELTLKRQILDDENTKYKHVVARSGSLPAAVEASELIVAAVARHVGDDVPDGYARASDGSLVKRDLFEDAPLEFAARLMQEDVALLRYDPNKKMHVFDAACVCFSFDRVPERLGLPMSAVHERVGDYERDLERAVQNIIAKLKPERPLYRTNWALAWSDDLMHTPDRYPWRDGADEDEMARVALKRLEDRGVGNALFLKVEYQTLIRLEQNSDALLFTVRVLVEPLADSVSRATRGGERVARNLHRQIANLPDAYAKYKGLGDARVRREVLAYLQAHYE
ncbi:DUF3445 domain-containing protein [Pycnococcus provasolii]